MDCVRSFALDCSLPWRVAVCVVVWLSSGWVTFPAIVCVACCAFVGLASPPVLVLVELEWS